MICKDDAENDNDDKNGDVIVLLPVGVRKSLTFPSSITCDEREQLLFPTNPPSVITSREPKTKQENENVDEY